MIDDTQKSKTMVLQQRNLNNASPFIHCKNKTIENVVEYTFVDSLIKHSGNLTSSVEDLAKKAKNVLFTIKTKTSFLEIYPFRYTKTFLIN